ncbi:hypothetical protein EV714DRAFT_276527 [Schizophyllum commune]
MAMSETTRRSLMRTADRAYYGVYTPSCPIQPDSLRNRVHGAATWISRSDKHGLISYESGLGKRKTNKIEFARYLEGLAKEMQPVLETLVKATVADDEPAPKAWQFELEMQKHARSLREARSHSDLSFAHVAASQQCARAVCLYRKYRKQAEDLLHATPPPELAQQMTNPLASEAPLVQCHTPSAAHEHPLTSLDPSICAEAQPSPPVQVHQASDTPSEPLLGLPAEGEEVGHGSPALVPPHKDVTGFAGDGSSSAGSGTGVAADWQCIARNTTQSGRMDEAAQQEPRAQIAPSEVALLSEEQRCEAHPLDMRGSPSSGVHRKTWRERLDNSALRGMEDLNPRGRDPVPRGYPTLPAGVVEFEEMMPRMTAKSSVPLGGHIGSSGPQLQAMKHVSVSGVGGVHSVQEESRAVYSPQRKLLQPSIPRAQRRHLHSGGFAYTTALMETAPPEARTRRAPPSDSSNSAPALELVEDAREILRIMAPLRQHSVSSNMREERTFSARALVVADKPSVAQ